MAALARAIGEMALARAESSSRRFHSLSAQIERDRTGYYAILESTQSGTLDVTNWQRWFLATLERAIADAEGALQAVMAKARFWEQHPAAAMNERQVKLLNRLLDGFEGKLTTSKWSKIAKCSQDTAYRDILGLVQKGALVRIEGGGRSRGYELAR
jgi:Fic family protein